MYLLARAASSHDELKECKLSCHLLQSIYCHYYVAFSVNCTMYLLSPISIKYQLWLFHVHTE